MCVPVFVDTRVSRGMYWRIGMYWRFVCYKPTITATPSTARDEKGGLYDYIK